MCKIFGKHWRLLVNNIKHQSICASKQTNFHPVTHVIFDLDGTLVNSEVIHFNVFKKLIAEHGKNFSQAVMLQIKGTRADVAYKFLNKTYDLPYTEEEFGKKIVEMAKEDLENVELMPGARKLICHLHQSNIPLALATSSSARVVHLKTHKNHSALFELFEHQVCGGSDKEVKRSKPAPDIFLKAAERFCPKPKPECCLVFEDAPNGVNAALAAGMQVVMVPDDITPKELTTSASLVLNSLEDFKPELFGLPKFPEDR